MNYIRKFIVCLIMIISVDRSYCYNAAKVRKLKAAAAAKNSNQVSKFPAADFRGMQLDENFDAHGFHMPGVLFLPCTPTDTNKDTPMVCVPGQASKLKGINLASANISNGSFDGADMEGADLTATNFNQGSAIGTNLKNAKVSGLQAQDTTFCNAIMPDGKKCDDKLKVWKGQGVTLACNCG